MVQQLVPLERADRDSFDMFARLLQRNARALAVSLGQCVKVLLALAPLALAAMPTNPRRGRAITEGVARGVGGHILPKRRPAKARKRAKPQLVPEAWNRTHP